MPVLIPICDIAESYAGTVCEVLSSVALFGGSLLQLLHTLCRRDGTDDCRDEACHIAERSLYLSHQLDECQHGTVCDGSGVKSVHTPDEGEQVACRETKIDSQVAETGEQGSVLHLPMKVFLCLREFLHHTVGLLQGLDYHTMLYALLKYALYAAIRVANLTGELAHTVDVYLAEEQEERCYDNDGQGQP